MNNKNIDNMKAENFAMMLAITAFEYEDTQTGESIPVSFGELINHTKRLDADLFVAKETIASLKVDLAEAQELIRQTEAVSLTKLIVERDNLKRRLKENVDIAESHLETANLYKKHMVRFKKERDELIERMSNE